MSDISKISVGSIEYDIQDATARTKINNITASDVGALPQTGGNVTGEIQMGGNKITNLGTPTESTDATTKSYVDTIKSYADTMLPKSGGIMTGNISMDGNKVTGLGAPTENADATTKSYVDMMLPKSGGIMTGSVAMGGNKITNLGAPIADTDAVNKGSLLNLIYPVGSIYTSISSTSPANIFGGTWEQLKDRFLLAAGDTYAAGATGGEAEHSLTASELPEHKHGIYVRNSSGSYSSNEAITSAAYNYESGGKANPAWMLASSGLSGAAHNNMPPYLAVYMWVRTA